VERAAERNGAATQPRVMDDHRFAVYDARVLRCSCGATMLATHPAALRHPVDVCDDDAIALHAAWCAELQLADFTDGQPATHAIERGLH
jgi:hypothetical protein